jgi:TonB family protein
VRAAKVSGTAAIEVSLDPKGRVLEARVAQSTGNTGLDTVAAQMARGATYTPKYVNCRAVAGTYTFTVKFVAW